MKEPWGYEGSPWLTSVAFFTYLRGCLRKAWNTNPVKINLIKEKRYKIKNPNPKGKVATVWGFTCELCNQEYPIKEGQVDHIVPAGTLRTKDDISGFVERLLFVRPEGLRLICKSCHSAVSHSEKTGMSFEEALIEKRVIAICKTKEQLQFIKNYGMIPASNATKRRAQVKEILRREYE